MSATPNSPSPSYTPPEVARRWRVSPDKVVALVRNGELKGFDVAMKRGGRPRFRILLEEVLAFEKRRAVVPTVIQPRARRSRQQGVIEFF